MIATRIAARGLIISRRLAVVAMVVLASLIATLMAMVLLEIAAGIAIFMAVVALTIWRPRYGLYTAVFLAVVFEPFPDDPIMYTGWVIHSNVSSWTPLSFVNFSTIELLVAITGLVVLANAVLDQRMPPMPQLMWPIMIFVGLIGLSIAYGYITGGSVNVSLWETRSMVLGSFIALLAPSVLTKKEHVHHLINLICIAVALLSVEIIWRRFTLLADAPKGSIDLAFAHETPIIMNFVVVLLVARLVWPASGLQRLTLLLVPLIVYAQMLTERRAGWVSLDVGLVLVAIFVLRLRPKVFCFVVVPLLILYGGYLAAFWNAEGAIAQPARAVRSINDPEGRDVYSNEYRNIERANVRMNIKAHPLTGIGFGQPYTFYFPIADLSATWPFFRYMAHVSLLWLWMKAGVTTFVVFLTLMGAAIVRGVQLLKRTSHDQSAPVLVAVVSGLLMLVVYSFVDVALTNTRAMMLLGFVLGVVGVWGRGEQSPPEVA